jgi:hypothetical protein
MKTIALALAFATLAAGNCFAFNPQPDPPAKQMLTSQQLQNPGTIRGFNPQPEPPGVQAKLGTQTLSQPVK